MVGAFREHLRGEGSDARFVDWICVTAAEHDQMGRDDRELMLFGKQDCESAYQQCRLPSLSRETRS